MSNDLAIRSGGSLAIATPDDWIELARQLDANAPAGIPLSYSKGDYFSGFGKDKKGIALGLKATAIVTSCKVGWHNFESGMSIFVPAVHQLKLPSRGALGDNDSATWVLDDNGKERDPWVFTKTMSMILPGEILYTFSTQSTGGKKAIDLLCKQYGKAISKDKAGKFPVITLGSDSYQHDNKSYGRIKYPVFEIVGWEDETKALAILAAGGDAPAPIDQQQKPRAADLVDDNFPSNLGIDEPRPGDEEIPWTE